MMARKFFRKFLILILFTLSFAVVNAANQSDPPVEFTATKIDASGYGDVKAIADIDGDGKPDPVLGNTDKLVWYETGANWASHLISLPVYEEFSTDMQAGDIDGDGDADLVVGDGGGQNNLLWFENPRINPPSGKTSDPAVSDNWTYHIVGSHGEWVHDIELKDMDSDGKPDIISSGHGYTHLWKQGTSGSWTDIKISNAGSGIFIADINRNGRPDIATPAGWIETPSDIVGGTWNFHPINVGNSNDEVLVTDINSDGRPDLVTANAHNSTEFAWYEAPADPTSADWTKRVIDASVGSHKLEAADFNGDGYPDILAGLELTDLSIYYNLYSVDGTFVKQRLSTATAHNARAGDINNDGRMDVFVADYVSTSSAYVFINNMSGPVAEAPSSGDGTVLNPYRIDNLSNLYWLSLRPSEWNKSYIQTSDIDALETAGWNNGAGFSPVGNSVTKFTGTYSGGDYSIISLVINRSDSDNIGLFGYTSGAFLNRISLENTNITGMNSVGGIAGNAENTTFENCRVDGTISGTTSVGGLTGMVRSTTVTNCSAIAEVDGQSGPVGGLMGYSSSGKIEFSFSSGNVTGDASMTGGLVGNSTGSEIMNSYSIASVNGGTDQIGGLVGISIDNSVISNCYSNGSINIEPNTENTGGLTGEKDVSSTSESSFWNIETSGLDSSDGGEGITTVQMQSQQTFTDAGWDFSGVWEIIGDNTPTLKNNPASGLPVELTLFNAVQRGNHVGLNWATSTESNNFGFDIERRQATESGWKKIGFTEGAGNSNVKRNYSFVDKNLSAGTIFYRLKQIDVDGAFKYSKEVSIQIENVIPDGFVLEQNYPNPFNPETTIGFSVPEKSRIKLNIYNELGQKVRSLINGDYEAGSHTIRFDASGLSSGIYFYKLESSRGLSDVKRMLLLK